MDYPENDDEYTNIPEMALLLCFWTIYLFIFEVALLVLLLSVTGYLPIPTKIILS